MGDRLFAHEASAAESGHLSIRVVVFNSVILRRVLLSLLKLVGLEGLKLWLVITLRMSLIALLYDATSNTSCRT